MNRSLASASIAAAVSLLGACSDPLVVTCDPARHGAECLQGGISGECVATCDDSAHYCAFPAPHDCPDTGLSYGVLSANHSATCVEECALQADGGDTDASDSSDASAGDAGVSAPSTVYVSFSATNDVQLFDANDLSVLGTVTIPPNPSESYSMFAVDRILWLVSQTHVVKLDLDTTLVAPGYPRYFGPDDPCLPPGSVFGPEGWTCVSPYQVQRWTGEPLTEGLTRAASSPSYLAHSTKRIFSVEGGQDQNKIVVYDANTLNEVPGSPLHVDKSQAVLASSEIDRVVVISWSSTAPGLYMFRESTLEPLGHVPVASGTLVWTVAFDSRRHHVVASVDSGFLMVYSGDDLSLLTPATTVSNKPITQMAYDAARDRFYGAAGLTSGSLVVVDAETLTNVPGSPVATEGGAQSLVLH